jgi:hypothetical protein
MRRAETLAQTVELLAMAQYRAPRRGQCGALACALVLARHPAAPHLLGFLARRHPTQGRPAQGEARRILRLAHAMALGHPAERGDGLGADGQAALRESSGLGGGAWRRSRGLQRLAPEGRGQRAEQRLTLGQGGRGASPGLAHLLALQPALGLSAEARDAVRARRQRSHARPQTGSDGAGLGPPSGRALEPPIGPGAQAVPRQKAGCGAPGGRRHTRPESVLKLPCEAPTGRQAARAGRVRLVRGLEHGGGSVGDSSDAGASQPWWRSPVSRLLPRAAAVCAGGCRAAQRSAAPLAPLGHRGARPGSGPCDGAAVAVGQRRGAVDAVLVRGIERSKGAKLARAQAHAESDPPEQAVAAGGVTQGETPPPTGGREAHERES